MSQNTIPFVLIFFHIMLIRQTSGKTMLCMGIGDRDLGYRQSKHAQCFYLPSGEYSQQTLWKCMFASDVKVYVYRL